MAVVARVFAVNIGLGVLAVVVRDRAGPASEIAALTVGAVLVAWLLIVFERGRT